MNCYRRAREAFTPGSRSHVDGQIDPLRLAELLCGERELVAVRVYRGLPSNARDPKGYGAARRQISTWSRKVLVTTVTRPLNYGNPAVPKERASMSTLPSTWCSWACCDSTTSLFWCRRTPTYCPQSRPSSP